MYFMSSFLSTLPYLLYKFAHSTYLQKQLNRKSKSRPSLIISVLRREEHFDIRFYFKAKN